MLDNQGMAIVLTERLQNVLQVIDPADDKIGTSLLANLIVTDLPPEKLIWWNTNSFS